MREKEGGNEREREKEGMKEREKEAERKNQLQLVWKCPTPQNQVLAATLKTHSEKKISKYFFVSFLSFNVSREGEKVKKYFSMTNTKRTFLTMIEVWKRSFKNG